CLPPFLSPVEHIFEQSWYSGKTDPRERRDMIFHKLFGRVRILVQHCGRYVAVLSMNYLLFTLGNPVRTEPVVEQETKGISEDRNDMITGHPEERGMQVAELPSSGPVLADELAINCFPECPNRVLVTVGARSQSRNDRLDELPRLQ